MKPTTITIDEILDPLLDLLNSQYPVDQDESFLIPLFGQFGQYPVDPDVPYEENPNEVSIELSDTILSNQLATRAIATLLWRSASNTLRTGSRFTETDQYRFPLRFACLKRSFWIEGDWSWNRYLIVDHIDEELDVEAAQRQIGLLVDYLRDTSNLVQLKPEDLAMF